MPSTFIGPEGLDELGIGSPRAIKSGSLLQPYPLNSIAADPTSTDSVVWDGGGADDDWTSAHNWNPDVIPNADDILHFAGTTRLSPVNDYGVAHAFAGIEFDAGAGAFTLGGNSITLNGNIFNESDNNQVINNDLIINAARDITSTNPTCGETRLNGDISGTGGLTISSANNTQFVLVYGNNAFTGPLVMRDCYCVFNTFANGGVSCALGAQSSDPANIVLFNDVIDVYFQYTGPTVSTDRGMTVTGAYGSGVFAIDTAGTVVTFNGVIAGDNILQIQTADLLSCAVVLTGSNTIVSVEPGYDGQVKFSSVSDIGTPCNIGIGTEMSAGIYSNGALDYTGPTASTNKVLAGSGTFRVTSSGVLTLTGTGTHTGVIEINSGTLQFGDGGATGSSVNSVSIVNNSALIFHTSSDQLYSATIISGSGTLTKRGATSAITLYGVNTYTGATYVEDGTLQIGNTLVDGSINNSASIAVSSGGVLTFSPVSSGGTYPNVISGNGQVFKAGVGTMIFTGNNTYTGLTTVVAGTLQVGNNTTTGVIAGNIKVDDALVFYRSNGFTYAGVLSGSGTIEKKGASMLLTGGANTFNGTFTITGAQLHFGDGSGHNGTMVDATIVNNGEIHFRLTIDAIHNGDISGSGSFTKSGNSSTVTLAGTCTYGGTTLVNAGVLRLIGSISNSNVAVLGLATLEGPDTTGASATISNQVQVQNTGTIRPGSFGNNTLNVGPLLFDAGAIMIADSTATAFSKIAATGDVTFGGAGGSIDFPAGITANGVYKLITSTGTMSGTLPTIGTNSTGRFCFVQQTANDLEIVVGWTPADIATAAWFDATDAATITESGGAVSQWNDKSGNARHATQGTGSKQPTTGASSINGLNALSWDGGDILNSALSGSSPAETILFVLKNPTLESESILGSDTDGGRNVRLKGTAQAEFLKQYIGSLATSTGTFSADTPVIVELTYDAVSSIFYFDGNAGGTTVVNPNLTAGRTTTIGAVGSGGDSSYFSGLIGEIVICQSVLSTADRQKIEGYLAWKWGGI